MVNYLILGKKYDCNPLSLFTEEYWNDLYEKDIEKNKLAIIDCEDYFFIGRVLAMSADGRYEDATFSGVTEIHNYRYEDKENLCDEIMKEYGIDVAPAHIGVYLFTRYS